MTQPAAPLAVLQVLLMQHRLEQVRTTVSIANEDRSERRAPAQPAKPRMVPN